MITPAEATPFGKIVKCFSLAHDPAQYCIVR